jgi:hypothetical protein
MFAKRVTQPSLPYGMLVSTDRWIASLVRSSIGKFSRT